MEDMEEWKDGRGEGWESVNHQVVLLFKHSMWFIFCGVLLTISQMVWADGGAIQFQGDSGATGQRFERLAKIDVIVFLNERQDIAAFAAGPATVILELRIDVERGPVVVVKGTQALPTSRSSPLELHMPLHHLDDVRPFTDIVDLFPGN